MKKFYKLSLLSCFAVVAVAFTCYSAELEIGANAPKFSMSSVTGATATLDSLVGSGMERSVLLLSFFDTACKPCLKELPHLTAIYEKYINDPEVKIRLVGLDAGGKKALDPYIKQYNVKIPVLIDNDGVRAGEKYGVVSQGRAKVPRLYVISKNKIIKKIYSGFKEGEEETFKSSLIDLIDTLKKEAVIKELPNKLTIVYSNSANGHFESCNCPENPYGGLVRRATIIKDIRKNAGDILLVDSGDNLKPYPDPLLGKYILKMFALMSYAALGIGDQDLINGSFWLNDIIEKQTYGDLPFLCSNAQLCDDKLCWNLTKPTIVKKVGKYKVGIISIISPGIYFFYPADKKPQGLKIKSSSETIKTYIDVLRNQEKVDVVVLLSHSGYDVDQKLAKQVPGIDVIVGGHSQTLLDPPATVNNTIILQAGENGQRLGRLTLTFDDYGKRVSYNNDFTLLTKTIADDEAIRGLINQYLEENKEKAKQLLPK